MGFIEQTLMPSEEIKFRTKLNRSSALVSTFVFGVLGLVCLLKAPAAALFFLLIPAGLWIKYYTSDFVVTNKRVLVKVGLFSRRSIELLLPKIESIQFEQNFIERVFFGGMGKVIIIGTGGTPESFANIDQPLEFRRQIQIQIESSQGGKGHAAA